MSNLAIRANNSIQSIRTMIRKVWRQRCRRLLTHIFENCVLGRCVFGGCSRIRKSWIPKKKILQTWKQKSHQKGEQEKKLLQKFKKRCVQINRKRLKPTSINYTRTHSSDESEGNWKIEREWDDWLNWLTHWNRIQVLIMTSKTLSVNTRVRFASLPLLLLLD